MNLAEEVYDTLTGVTASEYRLPWVESLFEPGKGCHEAYQSMLDAYQRLLSRLGSTDNDPDLEIMVNAMLCYSKSAALKMFEYGDRKSVG